MNEITLIPKQKDLNYLTPYVSVTSVSRSCCYSAADAELLKVTLFILLLKINITHMSNVKGTIMFLMDNFTKGIHYLTGNGLVHGTLWNCHKI